MNFPKHQQLTNELGVKIDFSITNVITDEVDEGGRYQLQKKNVD